LLPDALHRESFLALIEKTMTRNRRPWLAF